MTDEEKKVEETKVCKCSDLGQFFTQVAAIFLGVLLAILVSASILKPKGPHHRPMPPRNGQIERQIPPMETQWHHKHQRGEFKGAREEFKKDKHRGPRPDFQQPAEKIPQTR